MTVWPWLSRISIWLKPIGENHPSDAEPTSTLPSKSDEALDTIQPIMGLWAINSGASQTTASNSNVAPASHFQRRLDRRGGCSCGDGCSWGDVLKRFLNVRCLPVCVTEDILLLHDL